MKVAMKNPKTGEIKEVKVGWSWTLFFFSGFLGFPLFLRRLYMWGSVFLVLWVVNLVFTMISPEMFLVLQLVIIGLIIWIAIKGNEMTAKNYLENGWTFTAPDSDVVKYAKGKWGIHVEDVGK